MPDSGGTTRFDIEASIESIEKLRDSMGDAWVDDNVANLRAQLDGSGAVAQGDGAKAAGERGFEADDVSQSVVVTGDYCRVVHKVYQSVPGTPRLDNKEFERVLGEYLKWVSDAHRNARLYGLESASSQSKRAKRQLSDIFVPVQLRRFEIPSRDEVERHLDAESGETDRALAWREVMNERRDHGAPIDLKKLLNVRAVGDSATADRGLRLAIIGGAGSGKSTLLSHLAAGLADYARTGAPLPFELPGGSQPLVPLVVPLRYYRAYREDCANEPGAKLDEPRTGTLAGFLPHYLRSYSQRLDASEDFFDRLLRGGGCLLMLDGLDEIVVSEARGKVRQQIEDLVDHVYPGNAVIVTAREAGYRASAVFGDDFTRLDVQPLADETIAALVSKWCEQLYPPHERAAKAEAITSAIRRLNEMRARKDLQPFVSTPLMTTMVVSVSWGDTELPRERAQLYEACVAVILRSQYLPEDEARDEVVNWGGPWQDQRDWLSQLALAMHAGGSGGAAVDKAFVQKILSEVLDEVAATRFLEAVQLRGGLLEERAGLFEFMHLTFQEFLAARLLAKRRDSAFAELQAHVADPWWREVLLLVYGYARRDFADAANDYLEWLSTLDGSAEPRLAGIELAGSALLEVEKPSDETRRRCALRVVENLASTDSSEAPAALRVRAGNTLAGLGDPRFDAKRWFLPADETLGFERVEAGEFEMGGERFDDEKPQHSVQLETFYMARYPVTVAQFRTYIEESGVKVGEGESLEGIENHPVVLVSWHEALAYSQWLDTRLRSIAPSMTEEAQGSSARALWSGLVDGRLNVTLPSEAEWEKAARGTDGREYPWVGVADPNRANYKATKVGATSAVGCFEGGVSPYGCQDMSGNVWEWTRSLWGKELLGKSDYGYPYEPAGEDQGRERLSASDEVLRVLRGGSFVYNDFVVRCAYRYRLDPHSRNRYSGFRVVVSPFPLNSGASER